MKTIKQQYEQPLQFMSAGFSPAGTPRLRELDAFKIRLIRIARVQINSSISKQGRRFYTVDVTRQRTSAHAEPSSFELEFRHSTLRFISSQIRQICSLHSSQCTACGDMVDILSRDHIEPSRVMQCMPLKMRYSRLQQFLNVALSHTVKYAVPNAMVCIGCEDNVRVLAEVFQDKYFKSCGLI